MLDKLLYGNYRIQHVQVHANRYKNVSPRVCATGINMVPWYFMNSLWSLCNFHFPVLLHSSRPNISLLLQHEPEYRPPMSEVVHDLLEMIRRESPPRSGRD